MTKIHKRNVILIIVMALLMMLFAGCSKEAELPEGSNSANEPSNQSYIEPGLEFTKFNTQDIYGAQINEEIFKDHKLTLINVWGTFCGPCIEEMPALGEIQKEYASKGVNIVGIVVDVQDTALTVDARQIKTAQDIAEQTGADYNHLILSPELITERIGEISAIPASFFVDEEGNFVSEVYVGAREKEDWIELIEKELGNHE